MSKIRIVLVDDHKMFLDGMQAVLSTKEDMMIVDVFHAAKDALKALKSNIPDILITDVAMPEINGLEFVKMVNALAPNLKILIVSMFPQTQKIEGVKGYILKEMGFEELTKAIRTIVLDDASYFPLNDKAKDDKEAMLAFGKTILTTREKEVVKLIAKELTTDEIADTLGVSRYTIETHKKNIFLKLKVSNAAGLINRAMYLGYL